MLAPHRSLPRHPSHRTKGRADQPASGERDDRRQNPAEDQRPDERGLARLVVGRERPPRRRRRGACGGRRSESGTAGSVRLWRTARDRRRGGARQSRRSLPYPAPPAFVLARRPRSRCPVLRHRVRRQRRDAFLGRIRVSSAVARARTSLSAELERFRSSTRLNPAMRPAAAIVKTATTTNSSRRRRPSLSFDLIADAVHRLRVKGRLPIPRSLQAHHRGRCTRRACCP